MVKAKSILSVVADTGVALGASLLAGMPPIYADNPIQVSLSMKCESESEMNDTGC
jgi:hypothetical protein